MIRVLVADDSAAIRLLLMAILSADPEIEVIGEAATGEATVRLAERLRPDVITMDIHMPGMNGLQATEAIMSQSPTPIVIVSSAVRERDVEMSVQAMSIGALMALPKPEHPLEPAFQERAEQLINAVKSMSQVKVVRRWSRPRGTAGTTTETATTPVRMSTQTSSTLPSGVKRQRTDASDVSPTTPLSSEGRPHAPIHIVAIAASTGGPAALQQTLAALPANFPVPILVVQHIADGFIDALASWLRNSSNVKISVAYDGEALRAGHVYLAPSRKHLGVTERQQIALSSDDPIGGFRPSANHLFASVANAYGANALGVIMTGMGRDGIEGLKELHRRGGWVIAQDEATSVVYGMPREAVTTGVVNDIVPVNLLGKRLSELV